PIKSTKSSSLFLRSELYERKFEIEKSYGPGRITSALPVGQNTVETVNDAINYFTLLSLFKNKIKKCDPIYFHLSNQIDLTLATKDIAKDLSSITGFDERDILFESHKVQKGFEQLREDDLIVKIGTDLYPSLLAKTD